MAKPMLLEEFHVSFFISRRLPEREGRRLSRLIRSSSFRNELRLAIVKAMERTQELRNTTFKLSW
jgi:hypothetical protein